MCLFITIYHLFNPHLCLTKDVGLQDNGCVSEIRCANKLLLPWHAKQNINLIYNFSICCIFTLWSWPCKSPLGSCLSLLQDSCFPKTSLCLSFSSSHYQMACVSLFYLILKLWEFVSKIRSKERLRSLYSLLVLSVTYLSNFICKNIKRKQ